MIFVLDWFALRYGFWNRVVETWGWVGRSGSLFACAVSRMDIIIRAHPVSCGRRAHHVAVCMRRSALPPPHSGTFDNTCAVQGRVLSPFTRSAFVKEVSGPVSPACLLFFFWPPSLHCPRATASRADIGRLVGWSAMSGRTCRKRVVVPLCLFLSSPHPFPPLFSRHVSPRLVSVVLEVQPASQPAHSSFEIRHRERREAEKKRDISLSDASPRPRKMYDVRFKPRTLMSAR